METVQLLVLLLQVAVALAIGVALWRNGLRERRAKGWARGSKPIPARVVGSKREEVGGRVVSFRVETRFELPDLGERVHVATFPTAGKALLHSRIHRAGSVHPVVPNLVDSHLVFLPSDLRKPAWPMVVLGVLVVAGCVASIVALLLGAEE